MKTDQLIHERDSWRMIDQLPQNGPPNKSAPSDNGADERAAAHRAAWQQVIDHKLMAWARDPSEIEDDGLDSPSAEIIQRAIDFARSLQQAGYSPPTNVVPDPNGGIVFHRRHGEFSEEFHFWDDGAVEYCRFQDGRLIECRPI